MKYSLPDVIARGRRRLLRNALAVAGVRTACAAVGSFVLVLLMGADAVDWRWLAALPVLTFAAGVILAWRGRPTAYITARVLDVRLHLADTLSTAVFYWPLASRVKCDEAMRCRQREYAARVAAGVDPRAALPLRIPRSVLACLTALALLAVGLGVLRYRWDGHLDLRGPALAGARQWIRSLVPEPAAAEHRREVLEQDRDAAARRGDGSAPKENSGPDSSDSRASKEGEPVQSEDLAEKGKMPGAGAGQNTPEKQTDPRQQDDGNPTDSPGGSAAQSGDSASSGSNASQPGTRSGLLGTLSNSLANLASAITSKFARGLDAKAGQGGPSESGLGAAKTPGKGAQGSRGTPQNGPRAEGETAGTSPSDADRDGTSGRSDNPDQRGGNSAGSDDGSKQIRLAKQLEAMGKISVILGKRSQTVSGTAAMEVASGRTEVTTPYEARQAAHRAVESADQDRIPIEFEAYVQQYFRELRKRNGSRTKNAPERP